VGTMMRLMAGMILAGLTTPAWAELSAVQEDAQIVVHGNHFRLVVDAAQGGEIARIDMFDGSQWNRLLGADGQTCPQVKLTDDDRQYGLANDRNATIEKLDATPELIRFQTVGKPCAANGTSSPWTVKLSYEVYPEGAVFVDVDYSLREGNAVLTGSSMSLAVDQSVTKVAKYRHVFQLLGPETAKVFPSARVAFGVNPDRSFTNEIEALVEYRTPMGGTTAFQKGVGRSTWTLASGETALRAPFHYHNRFSMGLGSGITGMGKPTTNLVAQRGYDWFRTQIIEKDGPRRPNAIDEPPTDDEIDRMVAQGATFVTIQSWLKGGQHNGFPHDSHTPRDETALIAAISHAHEKGLRVNFYTRGIERYGLDQKYFEKYLKRDWDGIYVDWHGAHCVAQHEGTRQAEAAIGDVHFSKDGTYVAAREYFLFTKRLRDVVGRGGILIGHQGFGNSGVLANLCFDGYYPGEVGGDHSMFASRDEAVFSGMMGGGLCTPYPLSANFRTPQSVAKMAAWGLYPIVSLGVIDPLLYTPSDPADSRNQFHLPYWRLLAAIDADRATVYNRPSVNQIAATCSRPDFYCLVYRERSKTGSRADDTYLAIVANLGAKTDRSRIRLVPSVLGMSGEYTLSRVDPQTGAIGPQGVTTGQFTTGPLPPWGFQGYRLTPKGVR
jgi:hypothetical protein